MLCVLQPTKTLVFVVRSAQGARHTVRCRFNCVQADVCLYRTCLNWSAIYKPQLSLLCEISEVTVIFFIVLSFVSVRSSVQCGTVSKQTVPEAATIFPRPLQVDLWPFDLESGIRVTSDVGYLCAWLRPDVRDRQIYVRQTSDAHDRLMPPTLGAGIINAPLDLLSNRHTFRRSSKGVVVFWTQCIYKIPRRTPSTGLLSTYGRKICDFRRKSPFIPETVRDNPMHRYYRSLVGSHR